MSETVTRMFLNFYFACRRQRCSPASFMHIRREPQRNGAVYGYCEQRSAFSLYGEDANPRLSGTYSVAHPAPISQRV